MIETIRQNSATCKGKIFPALFGQHLAVGIDYRQALRQNLRVLLTYEGKSRSTVKAKYTAGPKAGKTVSSRTIGYVLSDAEGTSGLSVDGLGALAEALGVEAYHLLVPGLDPRTQPVFRAESWIEAEVDRRLAARLKRVDALLKTRELQDEKDGAAGPNAGDPWPHLETPAKHGKREAKAAPKARAKAK